MTTKTIKKNDDLLVALESKWNDCIGCKYNPHTAKKKLKVKDFQMFACNANINAFPCHRIPELYPQKLSQGLAEELVDGRAMPIENNSFELSVFIVEIFDLIHDNILHFFVASDNRKRIENHFEKILSKGVYNHLKLYRIKEADEAFENYRLMALPIDLHRIVYPEINMEIECYGEPIKVKEIVYDLRRYPGINNELCKRPNINVNERLSEPAET